MLPRKKNLFEKWHNYLDKSEKRNKTTFTIPFSWTVIAQRNVEKNGSKYTVVARSFYHVTVT